MTTNFVPIVTVAGRAAEQASKLAGGAAVRFADFLLGDGNGATPAPLETWTALVNQRASIPVASVTVDPQNSNMLWVTGTYQQSTPRGFTIRELAITLTDGTVYAVAAVPETFMPLSAQGAMRLPTFKIPFILSASSGNIVVFENPGQYATQSWVQTLFNTLNIPTIPLFATIQQHLAGVSESLMTHPKGVKAMIDAAIAALTIPAAFTQSVVAPLLWDANARIMSLRAATKTVTGFGRAATDAEASSGAVAQGAAYTTPWITPEQMAAAIAARDTADFAIGTTITVAATMTVGTSYTGAQVNAATGTGVILGQTIGAVLPGTWKCIFAHTFDGTGVWIEPGTNNQYPTGAVVNMSTLKRVL